MSVHVTRLEVATRGRGFTELTAELRAAAEASGLAEGLASVFVHHTSASLFINENADPDVRTDFESFVNHIIPENMPFLTHTLEGPDDMPAHIKAAFIGNSLTIPITNGRLNLGTWQGIYLCEFRNRASGRRIVATIYG